MKKIALYEPFYKGSHKYWADSLIENSIHHFDLHAKNGVFWKWRVLQSSIALDLKDNHSYDIILSTNMVNLAAWAGINRQYLNNTELIHYFHESQLSYPSQNDKDQNLYGFIDITSALCADRVAFNSTYHLNTFLKSVEDLSLKLPDKIPSDVIENIRCKSTVLPIGIDLKKILRAKIEKQNEIPVILWNHRHENDKNPDLFFETLFKIKNKGIKFQLVVLGNSPKKNLPIFDLAKERLNDEILIFEAVKSYEDYLYWLWRSDILPVTSNHDFFGISVLEAALCRNHLLLPKRNAYCDHFPMDQFTEHYYDEAQQLESKLTDLLINKNFHTLDTAQIPHKYSWDSVAEIYDHFFNN